MKLMILCYVPSLMKKGAERRSQEENRFTNDVKIKTLYEDLFPTTQEAGMMCMIDDKTFKFMKNTWNGDSGTSCHTTNDG